MHLRTEKDRSKYEDVQNMEVRIVRSHLKDFEKEFSQNQKNSSNKRCSNYLKANNRQSILRNIFSINFPDMSYNKISVRSCQNRFCYAQLVSSLKRK